MTPARPNRWQKILSEGARPDVRKSEQERREIEREVGHFVVLWGHVDFSLAMALSHLEGVRQSEFAGVRFSDKIKRLRKLIPPTWADGRTILDLFKQGNDHRNALSHWTLGLSGAHGEQRFGWHFWNIPVYNAVLEIEGTVLPDKARDAEILARVTSCLMTDELKDALAHPPTAYPLAASIREAPGQWDTAKDFELFMARVEELFPVGAAIEPTDDRPDRDARPPTPNPFRRPAPPSIS